MFEHFLPKQPPRSRVERARDQFSIYSRPFFNFEPRPELKKKNLELYSRTTTENVTGIDSEKQNGYLCLHSSVKSILRSRVQRARNPGSKFNCHPFYISYPCQSLKRKN